jgi:transketolase
MPPDLPPQRLANAIRALAMDAVEAAQSGHPGMPMGMADVATALFAHHLKFTPNHPEWPDRDRFVLSAGHGSMLLYALLYLTGYPDMTIEEIKRFRQLGSRTAGHPEFGLTPGIEMTTGPLGQGLGTAVGMALAERLAAERFGDRVVDHYTYVIASDGDLMEGISHEAASFAGHFGLSKLIVLYDDNRISIDGATDLTFSDDTAARFRAYGWEVASLDGHDPEAVSRALTEARETDRPSLIACRTTIAYGAPAKAGTSASHGAPLGKEEIAAAREALDWPHPPFEIPDEVLTAWRAVGERGEADYAAWKECLDSLDPEQKREFERLAHRRLPEGWEADLHALKAQFAAERPKVATRKASEAALNALAATIPELIGGSADLTGSNNTKAKIMEVVRPGDFSGRYLHFGVREHAMAAILNGLSLHGGFVPYGGTFLVFSDYLRPALRLSALMGQRVIYVLTHDSIGLGEDGPTHQPVEHLAALRAIPDVNLLRPADAVETAECWELALRETERPSVLALSRQGLPTLRGDGDKENRCARGAYRIAEADGGEAQVAILASGSEVQVALTARETLQGEGIPTAVVSLPCWELFEHQDEDYRRRTLGTDIPRIAIEAGVALGWERYVGENGAVIGMKSFGASAPAADLYAHFGITADAVVAAAKTRLTAGKN